MKNSAPASPSVDSHLEQDALRTAAWTCLIMSVVGLVVKADYRCQRVRDLDDLRRALETRLTDLSEQVVLDMFVTEDPEFAGLRIISKTAVKNT